MNRKTDTGKTLNPWPVFVEHCTHNLLPDLTGCMSANIASHEIDKASIVPPGASYLSTHAAGCYC
jgi:hypothetical protein